MTVALARKLFGSSNERRIKSYLPRVAEINALEGELEGLSDDALRARTAAFKQQVAGGHAPAEPCPGQSPFPWAAPFSTGPAWPAPCP